MPGPSRRVRPQSGARTPRFAACSVALLLLAAPSLPPSLHQTSAAEFATASLPRELARDLDNLTVQPAALIDTGAQSAEERNAQIAFVTTPRGFAKPFQAGTAGAATYRTALHCLTEAIYYEAANESLAGQRAVAQVILNRVAHPAYPSSVCGVVYQGWSEPVCQFSYTCDGSLARRPLDRLWRRSAAVAAAALNGHVEKPVGTATHYHADYVLPYWAYRLEKVYVEGRHIFYRFPGQAGQANRFSARWSANEHYPVFDAARFAVAEDEQSADDPAGLPEHLQRAPTERRADNDIGGRMDPRTGWRLTIPDPVAASSGLHSVLEQQGTQVASEGAAKVSGNELP